MAKQSKYVFDDRRLRSPYVEKKHVCGETFAFNAREILSLAERCSVKNYKIKYSNSIQTH